VARRRGRHAAERPSRRGLRITLGVVGALALGGLVLGVTAPLATAGSAAAPTPAATTQYDLNGFATGPEKTGAATATAPTEIRYVGSPLASDDPLVGVTSAVQCPDGTIAQTTDANGNESDCQPITSTPDSGAGTGSAP